MPRPDDDSDLEIQADPPYPANLHYAGVIWIIFGSLILLNAVVQFAVMAGAKGPGTIGGKVGGLLVGVVFLHVGLQSVWGTATGTMGNGIGSIIFSVIWFGIGTLAIVLGLDGGELGTLLIVTGVVNLLGGVGLLIAGILAILATGPYREWRVANKNRNRGGGFDEHRDRQRRRDDEDDRARRRPRDEDDDRDRSRRRDDDEDDDRDRRRSRDDEDDRDERDRRRRS